MPGGSRPEAPSGRWRWRCEQGVSGAEGRRDGSARGPGPFVDMCLGFGVETWRGAVSLCLGADVSDHLEDGGCWRKRPARDVRDTWADGCLWLVCGLRICCSF